MTNARAQVMIVDDESWIRTTVRDVLSEAGMEVLPAESGRECIEHLRKGFRGVILMDIMMPDLNGWETIRMLERESLIDGNLIVMLTALESPDEQMEGLQELVFDYLTKPFDPATLVSTVSHYLDCFCTAKNSSP